MQKDADADRHTGTQKTPNVEMLCVFSKTESDHSRLRVIRIYKHVSIHLGNAVDEQRFSGSKRRNCDKGGAHRKTHTHGTDGGRS